jgi:hypothetical protein
MINVSLFRSLTDEEFLNQLEETHLKSPIIKELHDRLNKTVMIDPPIEKEEIECPVCMAEIKVSFDSDANQFNLEI